MKKVLIIEDDAFLKEIEIGKFNKEGFDTQTAMTIAEIDDYLNQKTPDIILLDLMLPGVDGFGLLAKIRSDEKTKDVPVLIFSNLSGEEDIKKALEAGATEFMIKSNFTLAEIIEKIKTILKI